MKPNAQPRSANRSMAQAGAFAGLVSKRSDTVHARSREHAHETALQTFIRRFRRRARASSSTTRILLVYALFTLVSPLEAYSQGTVSFANNLASRVTNSVTSTLVPAGTAFNVALYCVPDRGHAPTPSEFDTDPDLQILGPPVGFIAPGLFNGGNRTVPGIPAGSSGWFTVRCWETAFGSTYEEARLSPSAHGNVPLLGGANIVKVTFVGATASLTAAGLHAFFIAPCGGASPAPACPISLRPGVNDVSIIEGVPGIHYVTFAVTAYNTQPTPGSVWVQCVTSNGTAFAGVDYSPVNTNVQILLPGCPTPDCNHLGTGYVTVPIVANYRHEPDRTFSLNLFYSGCDGVGDCVTDFRAAVGVCTILDDDPLIVAIDADPQSETVVVGNPIAFTVGATGVAPLSYQWRFNGADISGANGPSYSLGSVQASHAGGYSVVVSDVSGSVTSAVAQLTVVAALTTSVVGPGVITRDPNGASYLPGSTVTLTATPAPGGIFIGWSGDASGTNTSVNVVMTTNKNITANFIATCVPTPSGLVGWWPGGGNANDIVGTNNAVLTNGATFAAGKVGQAFSRDGTNALIYIPYSANLQFTSQFTIEAWVRPNAVTNTQQIVTLADALGAFILLEVSTNGILRLEIYNGLNAYDVLDTPSYNFISAGVWSHVAATFGAGMLTLFKNGGGVATKAATVASVFSGPTAAIIGGTLVQDRAPLSGLIDEVAVYNRALSAAEIAAIANAGSVGKCRMPISIINVNRTGSDVNLSWSAQKGVGYRVQYATNLASVAWSNLLPDVIATNSTARQTDSPLGNATQRFYRVQLLQ